MDRRLGDYLAEYQHIFRNRTKRFFDKAELYTKGIVQSQLRNIERISEDLDVCYHQMQHFISESNWDARQVIDQVALEVSQALPKRKLTGLIIDESGRVKKGDKSVGVGWQYCGNVGKLSNSQVAVFACLSNGDFASMVDARLYIPKDWCDSPSRCREAKIPDENRVFKTKLELAMEIIRQQQHNGISYDFIGGDGYYGNDADLADAIDDMGSETRLWLAWHHQVALNFLVSSFMLKEKLLCFDDLPLLSARDIKEWLVFKLMKATTEEQMAERLYKRHELRQKDINNSYLRE